MITNSLLVFSRKKLSRWDFSGLRYYVCDNARDYAPFIEVGRHLGEGLHLGVHASFLHPVVWWQLEGRRD